MMKKENLPAILGVLLLLFFVFGAYQWSQSSSKSNIIKNKDLEIANLTQSLEDETSSKEEAMEKSEELELANQQLEVEKEELNQEIKRLKKEIKDLKLRIKTQRETIEGIRADIKSKEERIEALKGEIAGLNKKKASDRALIKKLEAERKTLTKDISALQVDNTKVLAEKDDLVNQMMDKQEEEEIYKEKMEIIENTQVTFQIVAPRSTKEGKEVKRIKKNNWNHTFVELSMYHENASLIQNENFLLKIVDSNTRTPLVIQEVNPKFPDSENNSAIPFTFTENPVKLAHTNTQQDKSQNYEVHVYYVVEGKEFLLKWGTVRLSHNGKFVPIGY